MTIVFWMVAGPLQMPVGEKAQTKASFEIGWTTLPTHYPRKPKLKIFNSTAETLGSLRTARLI
ncbi:hypothetical protein PMN64_11245 [Bradyrhizobium sp. UFLA01-814]|uniref:hypothetical protein n=1 Tax=Bradyrhizobium sp. UFLA01-814 TaxID=3023480 RepID=UPI00398AE5E9